MVYHRRAFRFKFFGLPKKLSTVIPNACFSLLLFTYWVHILTGADVHVRCEPKFCCGEQGRPCAKQNAGWRSWGLFFASFLWASKEMKVKNFNYLKQRFRPCWCYHQQANHYCCTNTAVPIPLAYSALLPNCNSAEKIDP